MTSISDAQSHSTHRPDRFPGSSHRRCPWRTWEDDVADIGGQTGRGQSIGLRFTVHRTLVVRQVFVPNRNVIQINRYRKGYVRVYVDVQLPPDDPDWMVVVTYRARD